MRKFSNSTATEVSTATGRRQPARQARTNPSRSTGSSLHPRGSNSAFQDGGSGDVPDEEPGFCPALTHFTDAISALPKEMIRHYQGIKEADGKLWANKDRLNGLITEATKLPKVYQDASTAISVDQIPSENEVTQPDDSLTSSQPSSTSTVFHGAGPPADSRKMLMGNLSETIREMLQPLDEKVLYIQTAVERLQHDLGRCEESYPYIANEVSEEVRLGSMSHWALVDRTSDKKTAIEGGRTRLATTNTAAQLALDAPVGRSEARREAVAARKQRNQNQDSDMEEVRVGSKRGNTGKGRRVDGPSVVNQTVSGLGITSAQVSGPSKRRKVEKGPSAPTSVPMERGALGSALASNVGSKANGSPRDTPALDGAKKKSRASAAVNGIVRRRNNTNNSTSATPKMASSPVTATFGAKEVTQKGQTNGSQRVPQPRGRQNSSQVALQEGNRRPSSSTSANLTNGNGLHSTTADVGEVSGVVGRTVNDVKNTMKEAVNDKGEHLIEDVVVGDGAGDLRGGLIVGSRTSERSAKREEGEGDSRKSSKGRPPSISTRGGSKNSKTTTPVNASFAEAGKSRLARAAEMIPIKRSHKKGAGIAAQLAAVQAATNEEDFASKPADEDDDEGDGERYCYCNKGGYGNMVGCDGENCARSWFHLECVGLTKAPKNATWYCNECKEEIKEKKFNGSNGR